MKWKMYGMNKFNIFAHTEGVSPLIKAANISIKS